MTAGDVTNLKEASVTSQRDETLRAAYFCTLEQVKRRKVRMVCRKATEAQHCEETLVRLTAMIC